MDHITSNNTEEAVYCQTCTRKIRDYELRYLCARCGEALCTTCAMLNTQCRGCTPGRRTYAEQHGCYDSAPPMTEQGRVGGL